MTYTELEKSILRYAEELIRSEFKIEADRFYHYTTQAAADAIVATQTFHSSFIRSSSDSLEFSAPMASCRDCVCLTSNFFAHKGFPVALFKHFNDEATAPSARAYFISLSGDPNLAHMKEMYGEVPLEFKLNVDMTEFRSYGFFIKCRYVDDTKTEVFRLLKKWKEEVLHRAFVEHKVRDPGLTMKDWFYTLMQFCNTISIGIKQRAFELEDETRIVVFPLNPDAETRWHAHRGVKPLNSKSLIKREYLPLNLKNMGIAACWERSSTL
jgi:hypothetical protein